MTVMEGPAVDDLVEVSKAAPLPEVTAAPVLSLAPTNDAPGSWVDPDCRLSISRQAYLAGQVCG